MKKDTYPKRRIESRQEQRLSGHTNVGRHVYSCVLECKHQAIVPYEKNPRKTTGCKTCWQEEQRAANADVVGALFKINGVINEAIALDHNGDAVWARAVNLEERKGLSSVDVKTVRKCRITGEEPIEQGEACQLT